MPVVALTAHGFSGLQDAEALVLDWFESQGLELVHGQEGVLIGWSDTGLPPDSPLPALAVDVRFYALGNGWLQVRWTLQLASGDAALQDWAEELLASLRDLLDRQPRWQVDGP